MSTQDHIEALKAKHEALEAKINFENNRPHPDDIIITNLKKEKLRIKEEIEHMTCVAS